MTEPEIPRDPDPAETPHAPLAQGPSPTQLATPTDVAPTPEASAAPPSTGQAPTGQAPTGPASTSPAPTGPASIALLAVFYGAVTSAVSLGLWVATQLVGDWIRLVPLELASRSGDQLPSAEMEALAVLETAIRDHAETFGLFAATVSVLGAAIAVTGLGLLYRSGYGRQLARLLVALRLAEIGVLAYLVGSSLGTAVLETVVEFEDLAIRLAGSDGVLPVDVRPWLEDPAVLTRAGFGFAAVAGLVPALLLLLLSRPSVREWCASPTLPRSPLRRR